MNEYQKALDRQKNNVKKLRNKEFVEYTEDFATLQQLIDLHKKIKKDVEFLNEKDIQIFILPDGREILGYDITKCPSRIILAEAIREGIENMLKCLNRSDKK